MVRGRILMSAMASDRRATWLQQRFRDHDYEVSLLLPGPTGAPAPISLTPVVAGFDLWVAARDERFEALAVLDERVPAGRPLLALCSATSSDEVASYAVQAERVVGFSVLGPRYDDEVIEVVPTLVSTEVAVQGAVDLLSLLGLRTATLHPGAWPIVPRLVAVWINEAARALIDGTADAATIDAIAVGSGATQGPLALADEIGLDDLLAVLDALHDDGGEDRYRAVPLLRRLVLAGYTGRVAGRGFHTYR